MQAYFEINIRSGEVNTTKKIIDLLEVNTTKKKIIDLLKRFKELSLIPHYVYDFFCFLF